MHILITGLHKINMNIGQKVVVLWVFEEKA
jgi:hypothetical protein